MGQPKSIRQVQAELAEVKPGACGALRRKPNVSPSWPPESANPPGMMGNVVQRHT